MSTAPHIPLRFIVLWLRHELGFTYNHAILCIIMNIWFYLISCRFEEDSLIVGRVALNLSVGLRCLKVRVDSFQTSLWRCATVVSLLYLSNWFTTIPRQLTKLLDGIWKIASKIDEPWRNYLENTYHGIIVIHVRIVKTCQKSVLRKWLKV